LLADYESAFDKAIPDCSEFGEFDIQNPQIAKALSTGPEIL